MSMEQHGLQVGPPGTATRIDHQNTMQPQSHTQSHRKRVREEVSTDASDTPSVSPHTCTCAYDLTFLYLLQSSYQASMDGVSPGTRGGGGSKRVMVTPVGAGSGEVRTSH